MGIGDSGLEVQGSCNPWGERGGEELCPWLSERRFRHALNFWNERLSPSSWFSPSPFPIPPKLTFLFSGITSDTNCPHLCLRLRLFWGTPP